MTSTAADARRAACSLFGLADAGRQALRNTVAPTHASTHRIAREAL